MAKRSMYGENTVLVSLRVPKSKRDEILDRFYSILIEYNVSYVSTAEVKDSVIESSEKKSNFPNIKFSEKTPKIYDGSNVKSFDLDESATIPKVVKEKWDSVKPKSIDIDDEKKAKIAMLKDIASGKGLKSSDSFIVEKVPLEDKYDFEYATILPDLDSQVMIGTKGVAFFDRYDNGFFYVRYEGKIMKFSDKKEFDRFVKSEGVLL